MTSQVDSPVISFYSRPHVGARRRMARRCRGQTRTRTAYPHPGPDQHRRPGVGRRPAGRARRRPALAPWPTACWPRTGRRPPTSWRPSARPGGAAGHGGPQRRRPGPHRAELAPLRRVADTATARPASTTTAPCGWTRSPTRRRAACWPCCWWWPRPSATAPGSTSRRVATRTAGGRSTTARATTAAPGATWRRAATSSEPGVPGAAQPRRALEARSQVIDRCHPGRRPARPAR